MSAWVWAGALTTGLLAGCLSIGSGGDAPAPAYLQLIDPGLGRTEARAAPLVPALLIQPQPSGALADTVSIAYARTPDVFSYYQFASWTERPVRRLPQLLQRRLQAAGIADAVALIGDPLRADWLLMLHVDTLYHDAAESPGQARLAVTVELFDRRQRTRLARRQFEAIAPLARSDARAASAAMSAAVGQAFDQLLPWVEASLASATQPKNRTEP